MPWKPRGRFAASLGLLAGVAIAALFVLPVSAGQAPGGAAPGNEPVTFTKDIAPILQRSCQGCHHSDGVGPMSLTTYEEVRPFARSMKLKTGLRGKPGSMPPWFVEKNIGIQRFKNDFSLTDDEIQKIAKWTDSGAPMGNPADMPAPLTFADAETWKLGQPDLLVKTPTVTLKASSPDWWGPIGEVPSGLTEDRYVKSVEYKEVTQSVPNSDGRKTVGSRFIFHHLCWGAGDSPEQDPAFIVNFPCHEVGRNGDVFDPEAPRLLKAGTKMELRSSHLHSNGKDTKSYIEMGFRLYPKGYQPKKKVVRLGLFGNSMNLDIEGMQANQHFEAFTVLPENAKIIGFEPHMHAAGVRMCLDAISGAGMMVETLNCVGYDHSWVRVYTYEDDATPLLPKGTILRITGYFDNTPSNRNVADPRNWSGLGHRSIDNMMNNLGEVVLLSDSEFKQAMLDRRAKLHLSEGQTLVGCPLCGSVKPVTATAGNNPQ